MNSVFIDGRLTADAEVKYSTGGKEYTKFRIAHNEWRNGEEETSFYSVQVWKAVPLKKGDAVILEGKLNTYEYTDDQDQRRTVMLIVAFRCSKIQYQKIGEPAPAVPGYGAPAPQAGPPKSPSGFEDDIPF